MSQIKKNCDFMKDIHVPYIPDKNAHPQLLFCLWALTWAGLKGSKASRASQGSTSTIVHQGMPSIGRTCVWRFGHLVDPSKKQAEPEVNLFVNTRTPRTSTNPTTQVALLAKLVAARLVSSRGLAGCSGVNKQIDFVLSLFLTGVREVSEPSDTSTPIGTIVQTHLPTTQW